MLEKVFETHLTDFKNAKQIFEYFKINTSKKTYWELIDEVDYKFQRHLKLLQEHYGDNYLEMLKIDKDAILLQALLRHLASIHQWLKN